MINNSDPGENKSQALLQEEDDSLSTREEVINSPEYLQSLYEEHQSQAALYPVVYDNAIQANAKIDCKETNSDLTLLQKTHELLKSFGVDSEALSKPLAFHSWTRWGKNNRYAAKLIYGSHGDDGLVFKDFKSADKTKIGFFKNCQELSLEEQELRKETTKDAHLSAILEAKTRQAEAALVATQLWEKAKKDGISEYLIKKRIEAYGIRYSQDQYGRFLVVPLRNADGKLWNIQKIYDQNPNGSNNKWFLTDGLKKGCFHIIGKSLDQIQEGEKAFVSEGYATGVSVYKTTGTTVIVAFDGGNLEPVIRAIQEKYPNLNLTIAGDEDCWGTEKENLGRVKATEAANRYGCDVIFPRFKAEHHPKKPTDFNDLYCLEGILEVKRQIEGALPTEAQQPLECNQSLNQEWPDPLPIKETELLPVEPFDICMLPEPLQDWVLDISHRMQCPLDYVAIAAVVCIGSLIAPRCGIRPKSKDSWTVYPNLWGGIVGLPSTLKSPAIREVMSPLLALEREAFQKYTEEMKHHEALQEITKIKKDVQKANIRTSLKKDAFDEQRAIDDLRSTEDPEPPKCKRYKTNNSSIEKLHDLIAANQSDLENQTGILVHRDELISLLTEWEKPGHESDRGFFLEAWNGDGSYTLDRIMRGTVHVEKLCVSILGTTQPDKLFNYLLKSMKGENDGLLQRFQLLIYPDPKENWIFVDQEPNFKAQNAVSALFKKIASLTFANTNMPVDSTDTPYFHYQEDAQKVSDEWMIDLQTKKLESPDEPIVIEHLNKFRKLMPSLALIFHVIDKAFDNIQEGVTLGSALRAAAFCDYLESHARRIYGLFLDVGSKAASLLSRKISEGKVEDGFTARDIYRKGWSLLSKPEHAEAALETLVKMNWLCEKVVPPSQRQREKVIYFINPKTKKSAS